MSGSGLNFDIGYVYKPNRAVTDKKNTQSVQILKNIFSLFNFMLIIRRAVKMNISHYVAKRIGLTYSTYCSREERVTLVK